jgi:hypothetical protein
METPDEKITMKTLATVTNELVLDGYNENFMVEKNGLHAAGKEKIYKPEDVKINNFYRFEGESDPADNAILYAIETNDGKKGTLTDAFGPYSDINITKFIANVEEIHKVIVHHKHAD